MYVDDEPTEVKPKKPRKKAVKKVVPVGKNGLKKKRVVKSRMSLDAKGYMGAPRLSCQIRGQVLKTVTFSDRGLLLIRVRGRRGARRATKTQKEAHFQTLRIQTQIKVIVQRKKSAIERGQETCLHGWRLVVETHRRAEQPHELFQTINLQAEKCPRGRLRYPIPDDIDQGLL